MIGGSFTYWAHTGFKTGLWSPLIVAGPSIARVIAGEWSKDQVRQYLYDNIKVTAERATHYARMTSTPTFSLREPRERRDTAAGVRGVRAIRSGCSTSSSSRRWWKSWSPAIRAATSRAPT